MRLGIQDRRERMNRCTCGAMPPRHYSWCGQKPTTPPNQGCNCRRHNDLTEWAAHEPWCTVGLPRIGGNE